MCPDFAGKMQKKLREMRHLLDEIRKWKKLDFKDFDNFDSILKNAPRIFDNKIDKNDLEILYRENDVLECHFNYIFLFCIYIQNK